MLERKCDMCKSVIANESDNTPITLKNKQYDLCKDCVDKILRAIVTYNSIEEKGKKTAEKKSVTVEKKSVAVVTEKTDIEAQVKDIMDRYREALKKEDYRRDIRLKKGKKCALDLIEDYGAEKIIRSYLEGASSLYLAELIGITKTQMDAFFKKYNIRKRTYNNSKRSNKDDNTTKEGD